MFTTPNTSEKGLTFHNTGSPAAVSERGSVKVRPQLKMSMNRRTGVFTGKVRLDPLSAKTKKIRGVLLQHQNGGSGHVLINGRTGSVTITPK